VAFLGRAKSAGADHAHESPAVMTQPLIFLAALSVVGGFLGLSHFIGQQFPTAESETHTASALTHLRRSITRRRRRSLEFCGGARILGSLGIVRERRG